MEQEEIITMINMQDWIHDLIDDIHLSITGLNYVYDRLDDLHEDIIRTISGSLNQLNRIEDEMEMKMHQLEIQEKAQQKVQREIPEHH